MGEKCFLDTELKRCCCVCKYRIIDHQAQEAHYTCMVPAGLGSGGHMTKQTQKHMEGCDHFSRK